jgi:SAM-dependent methyltransferase
MTDAPLSPMEEIATAFAIDDYLYFHSDFLTPAHSDAETAAICALMDITGPMPVLDLACGFGRIANRLAARGQRVTGIEFMPGYLEIARFEAQQMAGRVRRAGGSVDYRQGDMRTIDFQNAFERVLMVFNSFGYFSDAENRRVLANAARALKPGGLLGFDIAHRDGVLNNFHPHFVSEKEGNLLINRFSFDPLTATLRNERIVIRDGQRRDRPLSMRLYALTEIGERLVEAGLQPLGFFEEWDGTPLRMDSPAMVVLARKPEIAGGR